MPKRGNIDVEDPPVTVGLFGVVKVTCYLMGEGGITFSNNLL